jgi:hypothetical protein
MGKITTQPLATETIRQAIDELKDDLYLELLYDDRVANLSRITPIYDDEIGLWEELEHRSRFCDNPN